VADLRVELWWKVEHLFWKRYRGSDGGLFGVIRRFGYRKRKEAERRG